MKRIHLILSSFLVTLSATTSVTMENDSGDSSDSFKQLSMVDSTPLVRLTDNQTQTTHLKNACCPSYDCSPECCLWRYRGATWGCCSASSVCCCKFAQGATIWFTGHNIQEAVKCIWVPTSKASCSTPLDSFITTSNWISSVICLLGSCTALSSCMPCFSKKTFPCLIKNKTFSLNDDTNT